MSTIRLFGKDIKVEEKSITLFGKRIFPHAALNKNKKQKQKQHYSRFINRINLPPANLRPPRHLCLLIRVVGGSEPVYIGRKRAEQSDVTSNLSRLLITATYYTTLLDDLIALEREKIGNQVNGTGLNVSVMDPRGNFHGMKLNRWNSLGRLVFNRGWNHLVAENELKRGDTVDLWHFETPPNQETCFAINIIKKQELGVSC